MSTLEDRLSAAHAARADLVRPEDLRPATPPPAVVPLRRRPVVYLLAAAACAAVVSAPFLVRGLGYDDSAPPVVTPTPVTPNGDQVAGADWPVVRTFGGYDVDGDGEDDQVVLRNEAGKELVKAPWRLEAQLSSGGTTAVLLHYDSYEINPVDPVDLDGDGADEILYYRGTDTAEIGALRYTDGGLEDLEVADDPGLTSMNDDQGRIRSWWVRDRQLFASRSVEGGFTPGDGGKPLPPRYPVEVWTWTVEGQAAVPVSQGEQCVRAAQATRPFPCVDSELGPVAGTQPAVEDTARVAEPFDADVDGDGRDDVVALEGPAGRATVGEGDVLLVVSLGGGVELSPPVPAGSSPEVFTTPYAAADRTGGLLVRQEEGDASTMTLYLVQGDQLVAARPEGGVRLGNGFDEAGGTTTRTDTWLTPAGRLFSRRATMDQVQEDSWQFFAWTLHGTRIVAEDSSGVGCWDC
jgi:hypothetical protein